MTNDVAEAARLCKKAAELDNEVAQWKLAGYYEKGVGVEKNEPLAFQWYLKSAENGFVKAQCAAAIAYWNGAGVAQDHDQAEKWLARVEATDPGEAYAQRAALIHDSDKAKGEELLRKAAELGSPKAQCAVGAGYATVGDFTNAVFWYQKAADQNYGDGQAELGLATPTAAESNRTSGKPWNYSKKRPTTTRPSANTGWQLRITTASA